MCITAGSEAFSVKKYTNKCFTLHLFVRFTRPFLRTGLHLKKESREKGVGYAVKTNQRDLFRFYCCRKIIHNEPKTVRHVNNSRSTNRKFLPNQNGFCPRWESLDETCDSVDVDSVLDEQMLWNTCLSVSVGKRNLRTLKISDEIALEFSAKTFYEISTRTVFL